MNMQKKESCHHTMKRNISRPRTLHSIVVAGITLLLVAVAVSFAYQGIVAHAQAPSILAIINNHASRGGYASMQVCWSVDSIINGDIDVALDQCGINNATFRASVVDWNAASTSIQASVQGKGRLYAKQCASIACATVEFSATAGDVICYQASGKSSETTTKTGQECYTVPAASNGSPTPTPTPPLHKGNGSPTPTPTPPIHEGNKPTPTPTLAPPVHKGNGSPTPTPPVHKDKGATPTPTPTPSGRKG
jgi:hypothetical protein